MAIVLLTLFATFLVQLGYFLWKAIANELPRFDEGRFFSGLWGFLTSWKWLLGMVVRLTGLALFIKATSLGDISVIQPIMASGEIFFILLVCIFLHERLDKMEWLGLFLSFVATVAIAFEVKVIEQPHINWLYATIFVILSSITLGTFIFIRNRLRNSEVFWGIAVGCSFGTAVVLIKLMTSHIVLSGHAITALTVLLNPMLALILCANITGLIFLQLAFQNARAAIIFPIQVALTVVISVLAGIFIFAEHVTPYRLGCIVFIIIGTGIFQYAAKTKNDSLLRKKDA